MIFTPYLLALSLGVSGVATRPIIKATTPAAANTTTTDSTDAWVSKCQTSGGGQYCVELGIGGLLALQANADACAQQNAADQMISLAKVLNNDVELIRLAQIFVQQPRDSADGYSVMYCQTKTNNTEIAGLYQCQYDKNNLNTFTGRAAAGATGTRPFGSTAVVTPAGSCPAHRSGPIPAGQMLGSLATDPGVTTSAAVNSKLSKSKAVVSNGVKSTATQKSRSSKAAKPISPPSTHNAKAQAHASKAVVWGSRGGASGSSASYAQAEAVNSQIWNSFGGGKSRASKASLKGYSAQGSKASTWSSNPDQAASAARSGTVSGDSSTIPADTKSGLDPNLWATIRGRLSGLGSQKAVHGATSHAEVSPGHSRLYQTSHFRILRRDDGEDEGAANAPASSDPNASPSPNNTTQQSSPVNDDLNTNNSTATTTSTSSPSPTVVTLGGGQGSNPPSNSQVNPGNPLATNAVDNIPPPPSSQDSIGASQQPVVNPSMTNNSAQDTNTTASVTQPPVPISPNLVLTALSSASSALAAAANALAQVATALTLQPNTTQPNTPPVCVSQYWSVAGDNCNSMAQQFGVTPADIFAANSFLACDNVWPNTPICVPAPSNANQPGQGSQGHFKQATEHSVQHNALTSHGTQHNVLNGNQRNALDSHSTQRKAVNTQGKAVQHDLASGDGSDGGGDPSQDPSQSQGGGGGGGCNHGEMQCQGDAFSICNWGQWVVIPCGSGTKCVALPDAGPTCTTDADAAMRMGSDGGGGQSDPSQQGPSQNPSQDPSQQQPPQDQSQGGDSGDGS